MAEHTGDSGFDFEAAAERIRELNERIVVASKKAGITYVDAYEQSLNAIADLQERVGEAGPVEWVSAIATAQAELIRSFARAYADAARKALE